MSSGIIYVPGQGLIKEMFGKTRRSSIPTPLNSLIPSSEFGSPESLILLYSIVHAIKGPFKHYIQQEDIRVRTSNTVLGVKWHMPLLILILIQLLPLKLPTVFLG